MTVLAPVTTPLAVVLLAAISLTAAAAVFHYSRARRLQLQANDLRSQLLHLQQRDTRRTESFATTVHELRAPLTSIRGALVLLSAGALSHSKEALSHSKEALSHSKEALSHSKEALSHSKEALSHSAAALAKPADSAVSLDERASNLLRIAAGNTGRLVRLIDDLLELERMESDSSQIELHPCSLNAVLAQAVETMLPMAQEAAIELHAPTPVAPLHFAGDTNRMVQVLCNLLSNSIKFSPPDSVISLSTTVQPRYLVLRVHDQGRGIPADKLEAVFERFVRVGPPLSPRPRPDRHGIAVPACSGLGLAISRSIVALHGGTLHAERNDASSPGRPGTTLVLCLPRLHADTIPESTYAFPTPQ